MTRARFECSLHEVPFASHPLFPGRRSRKDGPIEPELLHRIRSRRPSSSSTSLSPGSRSPGSPGTERGARGSPSTAQLVERSSSSSAYTEAHEIAISAPVSSPSSGLACAASNGMTSITRSKPFATDRAPSCRGRARGTRTPSLARRPRSASSVSCQRPLRSEWAIAEPTLPVPRGSTCAARSLNRRDGIADHPRDPAAVPAATGRLDPDDIACGERPRDLRGQRALRSEHLALGLRALPLVRLAARAFGAHDDREPAVRARVARAPLRRRRGDSCPPGTESQSAALTAAEIGGRACAWCRERVRHGDVDTRRAVRSGDRRRSRRSSRST